MTHDCISIVNYIINQYNNNKEKYSIALSTRRIQRLMYFSEILYMLTHHNSCMITDEFYAWPSGPVIADMYDIYMQYQSGNMLPYDEKNHVLKNKEIMSTVDRVLEATKDIDTCDLDKRSQDFVWRSVYKEDNTPHNDMINNLAIRTYYKLHGAPYGA